MSDDAQPGDPAVSPETGDGERDYRLYIPHQEMCQVQVKPGGDRQYCYHQLPGEDHFHLIMPGEVFIQTGDEKLCLNCAVRQGVVSPNRLFWQTRGR